MSAAFFHSNKGDGTCCTCDVQVSACADCPDSVDCSDFTVDYQCGYAAGAHCGFFAFDGSNRIFSTENVTLSYTGTYGPDSEGELLLCGGLGIVETAAAGGSWTYQIDHSDCSGMCTSYTGSASVTTNEGHCVDCHEPLLSCNLSGQRSVPVQQPCVTFAEGGFGCEVFPGGDINADTCPQVTFATATATTVTGTIDCSCFTDIRGCNSDGSTITFTLADEWSFEDWADALAAASSHLSAGACTDGAPINGGNPAAYLNYQAADHTSGDQNCWDYMAIGQSQFRVTVPGAVSGTITWSSQLFDLSDTLISTTSNSGVLGTWYPSLIAPGSPNGYIVISEITVTACSAT